MVLLFALVLHETAYTYLINRSILCWKCRYWLQNPAVMSFLPAVITIYCRISECYFTDRGAIVVHFALVSSSSFFYIGTCDAAGSRMVRWYRFRNSCESPAVLALSRLSDYLWTCSVHHVFLCASSPCFVTVCCSFLSVSTSYIYISIFVKIGVIVVVIFVKYYLRIIENQKISLYFYYYKCCVDINIGDTVLWKKKEQERNSHIAFLLSVR